MLCCVFTKSTQAENEEIKYAKMNKSNLSLNTFSLPERDCEDVWEWTQA